MMYALVVCNGSIIDYSFYRKFFDEADFIVLPTVERDFDSIESEHLEYIEVSGGKGHDGHGACGKYGH